MQCSNSSAHFTTYHHKSNILFLVAYYDFPVFLNYYVYIFLPILLYSHVKIGYVFVRLVYKASCQVYPTIRLIYNYNFTILLCLKVMMIVIRQPLFIYIIKYVQKEHNVIH